MTSRRLCLAALLVGAPSWADVEVNSTSMISATPDPRAGPNQTMVPLRELVGLHVRRLETPLFDDVGVTLDAWGALTLPSSPPSPLSGDITLLYVEGSTFQRHLQLRLGRQFVSGGVARAQFIDGVWANVRGPANLGLSAFIGEPVVARFANYVHGGLSMGARASWSPLYDGQVGVSILNVTKGDAVIRQDVGVDGRWAFSRRLNASAALAWSIADKRLEEFHVGPHWQPLPDLDVSVGYRRTAPDLFLSRDSIFSVFADTSRDDLGLELSYQVNRALSVFADGRALWVNSEAGYELLARAAVTAPWSRTTNASVTLRRMYVPAAGLTQARVGGRHVLPNGLGFSLDVETYVLDQAIRGRTTSVSGSATVGWQFAPAWFASVACFAGSTPYAVGRVELMGKVTYTFPRGGSLQ